MRWQWVLQVAGERGFRVGEVEGHVYEGEGGVAAGAAALAEAFDFVTRLPVPVSGSGAPPSRRRTTR